jgi:hypothetical protein
MSMPSNNSRADDFCPRCGDLVLIVDVRGIPWLLCEACAVVARQRPRPVNPARASGR